MNIDIEKNAAGLEPCPWHRHQYPVLKLELAAANSTPFYNVVARCDVCFAQRVVMVQQSVIKKCASSDEVIAKTMPQIQQAWNWSHRK